MMSAQLQQPSSASRPNEGRGPTISRDSQDSQLAAQLSRVSIAAPATLQNRAAQSTSPYVRAHADSPVAWQLLDDEAVQRARTDKKLIFMNIGFNSCHYCRLTTLESFNNPDVANLLNTAFVPILVDREERPDIDAIYMNYIQAVNGSGGWPLNIFLTPQLEPVYGGTYWPGPGTEMIGLDGQELGEDERLDFVVILNRMRTVWKEQEGRCRGEAKEIISKLREFAAEGTLGARGITTSPNATTANAALSTVGTNASTTAAADSDLDLDQLEEAYTHLASTFDWVNGGFGMAPKFPTPARLSFLLRLAYFPPAVAAVVGDREVAQATNMALQTLRRIRDGGLRDHIGGGFHRYAVTANWAMPHFEKMVADNALLLGVYLDAWLSTVKVGTLEKDDEFANVVFELAQYLTSPPILLPDGGFATSEAADSYYRKGDAHMREGAYYLWTRREFDNAFGGSDSSGQQASAVAAAHWNVLEHGNVERDQDPNDEFMTQNVLYTVKSAAELGHQFGIEQHEVQRLIETARGKLKAHREKERVRPETDEKAVTSINAMVIAALARTSGAIKNLDSARSDKYLNAAKGAAGFIKAKLWDSNSKVLYRSFHDGETSTRAFAEDFAFLIEALLDLYEVTADESWLEWADELQLKQIELFYDPTTTGSRPVTPMAQHSACGGFYTTEDNSPHAILRLKDGMDTALPSTNSVSSSNLFRLGTILGSTTYMRAARETINAFEVETLQYPWLFLGLLSGVVTARLGGICWVAKKDDQARASRRFSQLPRAGLRSLIFHQDGDEAGSWLRRRNPALRSLQGSTYQYDKGEYQPYEESGFE